MYSAKFLLTEVRKLRILLLYGTQIAYFGGAYGYKNSANRPWILSATVL